MTAGKPALTLDLLKPEREYVRIKTKENRRGFSVAIKTPEELSLLEQSKLALLEKELAELEPFVNEYLADGKVEDESEEVVRYEELITEFIRLTFDGITDAIAEELELVHKLALMTAFTAASPEGQAEARKAAHKATKGGRSSRSNGRSAAKSSSAGNRKGGSKRRSSSSTRTGG